MKKPIIKFEFGIGFLGQRIYRVYTEDETASAKMVFGLFQKVPKSVVISGLRQIRQNLRAILDGQIGTDGEF